MKMKRLWALLLVVCLGATMASGCGKSEPAASGTGAGDDKQAVAEGTQGAKKEEIAEINVVIISLGPAPAGAKDVENAVNEITEPKINTHVNLEFIDGGTYADKVSLKMISNEKMDLLLTMPIQAAGFSSLVAQNQLLPLDDLLTEYAPELLETVGDFVKATSYNGHIYAVPNYRVLNSNSYLIMRKDILDNLGLTEKAKNLSSWSEYEEIIDAVCKNYDIAGISQTDGDGTIITEQGNWTDKDVFAENEAYDTLGDTYKIIAVDPDTNTVFNYFASERYRAMLERVNSWYQKGYVYKDSATSEEQGDTLIKNNVTFSTCVNSEIGVEISRKSSTGYDVVCPEVVKGIITTGSCTKFTWAVPVTATEPEAAAKFMNLLFTDADINNLLAWGIEGKDYIVKDGVATYPEGVDASNVSYHTADFLYGNQFLIYPWEGVASNFREVAKADMEAAETSKYLGFSCDTTNITNEITAVYNVIQEYKSGLESGSVGLERYDEFISKMEAAGVDKVVAEYQKQLDAWLAQQ
ncbi:MAG TPA: ABC transporter substrate-binding protein [Clostridiales bacterium]|nr:ABC transporter substrate-binding protein [Clostridiales bacterium]